MDEVKTDLLTESTEQHRALELLNQRNEELAALNAIAQILSNPLELTAALDQVCAQITLLTGMESAAVYLVDERREYLHLVAQRGVPEAVARRMQRLGLDDPLTFSLFSGAPLTFDDVTQYPGEDLEGPRLGGYRALIAVPILQRAQSVGIVGVGSLVKSHYDRSDLDLMWTIGRQIGKAYENAKLYQEMQKRVQELDGLAQLSAACIASLDPVELAKTATTWTAKLISADFANLRLLEGNTFRLIASHSSTALVFQDAIPMDEFLRSHFEKHIPVIVTDTETDDVPETFRACAKATGIRSNCIVPLRARECIVGALSVGYRQPHRWESRELELVQTIAHQVTGAIDNAQLFQKVVNEQRKVQAIFDSGLSGLFATDAEGRIVMFNRAAERTTGWASHEVQGKRWQDVFSDLSKNPPTEPLINFALEQKETRYVHAGHWLRTRDGRVIPVAKAVAPLLDEQGNVTGAVGAFFDLSREQAAELEREEFLKEVAHQLRSPLTAVLSAVQLLERPNLSEARRAEMWNILKRDGERLKRFADQFLDLEAVTKSQRPLKLVPLPIAGVTRALVRQFRAHQRQHHFHVRTPQRDVLAFADLDRVENTLRNLLDNAVSYAPPNTRITIIVKPTPDQLVQISVQDCGPGIPSEDHEKIFSPFYRSTRAEGRHLYSHGLGLAIAKRNIVEMGGTLWLESRLNHGATFHFTLRRYR